MERLSKLRKEKHMTQLALALKLNVSQKMISAYENGVHQPSMETLIDISKIFNVSIDYLLGISENRHTVDQIINNVLSPKEQELLDLFRELNLSDKEKAIGIIFALSELDK